MSFRFGLYSFDPRRQRLERDGAPVALEPQPARALGLLLSRAGQVVTREELREALWGEATHVDFDRGIAYVLSQIRLALQDSAANPRFVQTVPRQGYRFIAPVEAPAIAQPSSRRRWVLAGALGAVATGLLIYAGRPQIPQRPGLQRLGVSIFDNETGADFDRWVHALSDLVVVALAELAPGRVTVIGNAAPLRRSRNIRNLKSLARELDVDYLVLGQLQNQGDGFRFITHLIRLPEETHLRARRLVGKAAELPALESAVVGEYVRAVREHVLGAQSKS